MAKKTVKIKTPPNSKESEMMVLGCMLTSVNGLNIAADELWDRAFYYTEHQEIFRVLKTAYHEDKPADIHIVSEELKKINKLEEVGGISYLTSLAQYAGTSAYIEEYIKIIKEKAILRRMIEAADHVEKEAMNEKEDVATLLDEAQGLFYEISQTADSNKAVTIRDVLSGLKADSGLPYLKELQERQERFQELGPDASKIIGVPTGLTDLDTMINGFNSSNLMILAARPAMGKTALGLNFAESICFKHNVPVAFFSLEMSADQLIHRLVCSQSEVESDKITTGSLDGHEYQKVVGCVKNMQKHTLIIDDQPGLKVTDLRSRARRLKETYDIGFIVIDYLQLLSGSGNMRSTENRQLEVSEISRLLKTLARELNIPILCLSQLSRRVEERQGHRPMLSDLRESGSLEQDSDLIFFLLRRDYYDPYDKPGMAELIIAKNRHGPVGNVNLVFRKELGQFKDYTPIEAEDANNSDAFSAFSPSE